MSAANHPHLEIKDLTMAYGEFLIQRDLTFNINRGDIFIIMGGKWMRQKHLLRHWWD
jgi:phospholipid/cholesterol/gamma-HCH transport system ATP-binding protein